MNDNLFATFAMIASASPSSPFVQTRDRTYGYGDMLKATGRAAAALQQAGVTPGDRVLVQVEKSFEAVILYLATLRAGAVFIPLNPAYTAEEVVYFLTDAEPKLLIASAEMLTRLASAIPPACGFLSLEADGSGSFSHSALSQAEEAPVAECSSEDVAAILYTSGTTGRSKGAMLSHGNLLANVQALNQLWEWSNEDVLIHSLPIFHAHGLFVALHCAMLQGSRILFHQRFDPVEVLRDMARATVFMGVPTLYVRLLKQPQFDKAAAAGMRLFISGSAPLTETVFAQFEERTGHRILERYGMTEALMITSNPYRGERIAGSVGYALPGVSVRTGGEAAQASGPGVIEITGPSVFRGYWRQPEKTAESFTADGFFRTGDIARLEPDGRVYLVGRATDLVISGGYNVYPKEIEAVIDDMPGIEEAAVIGVPHPDFGEAVVAIVVASGGLIPDQLDEALRPRLAAFKRPKRILLVDELPRNAMGKVEKAALRNRYRRLFAEA